MATQILLIIETADVELFKGIIRLIFDKVRERERERERERTKERMKEKERA
jgi:hypothetical protein